jgi:hypothetical protein
MFAEMFLAWTNLWTLFKPVYYYLSLTNVTDQNYCQESGNSKQIYIEHVEFRSKTSYGESIR